MTTQIEVLESLIKVGSSKPIPPHLQIFLVWKNSYTYANNGFIQQSHSVGSLFTHLRNERGDILDAFSKLEFLLRELVRIKTMGEQFSHDSNLVDLVEKPNISNLLQLLKKWKVITNSQQGKSTKLFGVRNQLAHIFSLSEAKYDDKPLVLVIGKDNFKQFHLDIVDLWKTLVQIYSKEQSKIDYSELITEIQDYQKGKKK